MKIDLQKDRAKLRKYIEKRIRDYPIYVNIGPGEDEADIGLITLGYYAEQGGYVNLVFDTRPDAEVDGEWTCYIDNEINVCPFPKWYKAFCAICDGKSVTVIKHDGATVTLTNSDENEVIQAVFGEMLSDLLAELRDDGTLAKLPLAREAFMVVEEFDGRFIFPEYKTRKTAGRIIK